MWYPRGKHHIGHHKVKPHVFHMSGQTFKKERKMVENMKIICPVCNRKFENTKKLYLHMVSGHASKAHKEFYKAHYEEIKELLNGIMLDFSKHSDSEPISSVSMSMDEENVPTLTTYEALREILVNVLGPRFKNIDGIVWAFEYYKPNDFKKLNQLLQDSAVPEGKIRTIIEIYEKVVRPMADEEEELTEEEEKKQKQEKKHTDPIESLEKLLNDYEEALMKQIEKEIKLKQLITMAKNLGIDLSGLSIDF